MSKIESNRLFRMQIKSKGHFIRKEFLFSIFLIFLSIFIVAVSGEVVLRLLNNGCDDAAYKGYPQGLYCRPHPLLGWIGIPGIVGSCGFPENRDMNDMHILINSDGFLDDPHKIDKPEGVRRILFLGDSFTVGYGIDRPFRFTDIIKERLSHNYEIINMGIWGYGTDQEFILFKEKALKYKPDIVGLVIFLDDLYTTNLFSVNGGEFIKPKFVLRSDGALSLTNTSVPSNHTRSLFFNSIVTRFYCLRNIIEVGRTFNRQDWFSIFEKRYYKKNMHVITLRLISEIQAISKRNRIKLFLVIVPYKDQILLSEADFQMKFSYLLWGEP